jgi:hypothetical protein
MKKIIISLVLASLASGAANAQTGLADIGIKTVGAGLGYAIGQTQNDKWEAAGATGAVIGLAAADYGYKKHKSSSHAKNMNYYMSGVRYQRWGQAKKHWHTYTLDPTTGKPTAFQGLDFSNTTSNTTTKAVKSSYNINANKPSAVTKKAIQVPVVVSAGKHGGVERTQRTLWFPKLP